jgi:integrase/recombinase XerD
VLNRYFIRPTTVDRIRASWIGDPIERYVVWLGERSYAARNVFVRVPILIRFVEFAQRTGASRWEELPAHVESFIEAWLARQGREFSQPQRQAAARCIRNPIQQLLRLILTNGSQNRSGLAPLAEVAPGFFDFLRRERGLRETALVQYRHYLHRLQDYLQSTHTSLFPDLPLSTVSSFITDSGATLDQRSVQRLRSKSQGVLSLPLSCGLMTRDLGKVIESPRR